MVYLLFVSVPLSWCLSEWLDDGEIISPSLVPFVKEWMSDMDEAGIAYENEFADIRHIELAYFFTNKAGSSSRFKHMIEIKMDLAKRGPASVKATLYHELGHYIFQLKHDCCVIMERRIRQEADYTENWNTYLTEYLEVCKASLAEP
ncbi:hypothetical protein ACFLR1_04070 [Bacteroidota bacterium]